MSCGREVCKACGGEATVGRDEQIPGQGLLVLMVPCNGPVLSSGATSSIGVSLRQDAVRRPTGPKARSQFAPPGIPAASSVAERLGRTPGRVYTFKSERASAIPAAGRPNSLAVTRASATRWRQRKAERVVANSSETVR